jgi:hypothetical protein
MSGTALQVAQDRAKHHGIKIAMHEDFARYQIVVRGQLGDIAYDHRIDHHEILSLRIEDMDAVYADAHHKVIDALVGYPAGGTKDTMTTISELRRELDTYKSTVKMLAFQLEMAEQGGKGVLLKEDEVRRLALEQAAEHLMDHGVIATGSELVEVCEQIKKLHRSEVCV